jgi:hypothetical protein
MTGQQWLAIMGTIGILAFPTVDARAASQAHSDQKELKGEQHVQGVVEDIKSDQIQVNIGEVQPRFIPLNQAKEKGIQDIKKGDRLDITINDQNLLVDFHLADGSGQGHSDAKHQVVKGQIAQPLVVGHDQAVIRTAEGKEVSFVIRSQARSKMASIPVGTDAVFLVDEGNKIVDVNMESKETVNQAGDTTGKKSPLKGNQRRVIGTIVTPLDNNNQVTIRTEDGKEHPYEVRSLTQDKATKLTKGESIVLLVDDDNKVVDIAGPPSKKEKK